ncbi:MAG: Bpu10I family restriction endonuclease [Methanotrichaceae archaeon]
MIPEIKDVEIDVGQSNTFSSIYFASTLGHFEKGGGLRIRSKDQDFAITKRLYLKSSFNPNFSDEIIESTNIAYLVAECKTNLDKTMFQEATATAHDVKTSVPGAKYFLLCEWLDMTPISTAPTDIDEVIILRKAKRMSSTQRATFSTYNGRQKNRDAYKNYLETNPIRIEMISRFIEHIRKSITRESLVEKDVIENGYF